MSELVSALAKRLQSALFFSGVPSQGSGMVAHSDAQPYAIGTVGESLRRAEAQLRTRAVPDAAFNWFSTDFQVLTVSGPGEVTLRQDLRDAFELRNSALVGSADYYVHPSGLDTNSGTGWQSAFKTLAQALRNVASGTIYLWPGSYDMSDFRRTDVYGASNAKRIIAPFGGVTLEYQGDDLGAKTWTLSGTYGGVYQTTLTTANRVTRLLRLDFLDESGLPMPYRQHATIVDLGNSIMGWHFDAATKVLSVKSAMAENINAAKVKGALKAIYGDSATGDQRTLLYSSKSYWEGIVFNGYVSILKEPGQAAPEGWFKNCHFRYSNTHALLVEGGDCFTQDCTAYRPAADGANYNLSDGYASRGVEINYVTRKCGDADTWPGAVGNPQGLGENKNASSNHSGVVVRINGRHSGFYGPGIADTAGSKSWNLGVVVGRSDIAPNTAPGLARYGILNQGNQAWCDLCAVTGNDGGLYADAGAVVKTYACRGSKVTNAGGTFTEGVPS